MDRREFLGCSAKMLVAGAALSGIAPVIAMDSNRSLLWLRSAGDEAVANGVTSFFNLYGFAHLVPETQRMPSIRQPAGLAAMLQQHRGMRLLAVADDAAGIALHDALRRAGASFRMSGSHAGNAAGSRHHGWASPEQAEALRVGLTSGATGWQEMLGVALARMALAPTGTPQSFAIRGRRQTGREIHLTTVIADLV